MHEPGSHGWAAELLKSWRSSRDVEALGLLLKWQRDRAYAVARRILSNDADAEDATQQAFVKMLSRTQGFDSLDNFKLAVYRAVVQCALDAARANRVRVKLEKAMGPMERNAAPIPQLAAEQAEALRLVWQELHTLPEDLRALVVLCYQEGLSVSDAAEVLAVPRETLRDRLASAMSDLRSKLKQRGVALSLLMVAGLLQHGRAEAAPAALCEALDVVLPGPPCASIPAEFSPLIAPDILLSETLGAAPAMPALAKAGLGLAACAALSAIFLLSHSDGAPPDVRSQMPAAASAPLKSGLQARVATPTRSTGSAAPTQADNGSRAGLLPDQAPPLPEPAAAQREANRANAINERDDEIPLDALPVAVKNAAARAMKGVVLTEAEHSDNLAGGYELKGQLGGKVFEFLVNANGDVLEIEADDEDDEDNRRAQPAPAVPPPSPAEF